MHSIIRACAAVLAACAALGGTLPAVAQSTPAGTISGVIADRISGLPVADAQVTVYAASATVATAKSDARGTFRFSNVAPGVYSVVATASGYDGGRSRDVAVLASQETVVSFALNASLTNGSGLKVIASTTASAGSAIAATTTISRSLDPALLASENNLRFGDSLRTLPGVNLGGLSSSVGDDLYLNIRGLGESETQALLDGHPVGSLGVYSINSPSGTYPGGYNFANSPYYALSKVQVTFGSGASGLYGVDATGGTVNMETLSPTKDRQFSISQGVGDQGRDATAFKATGTLGRMGYAFAGSVQGTYGEFPLQQIPQTGRPNNSQNANNGGACLPNPPPSNPTAGTPYNYTDLTSCNLALNTYPVSQNTTLRSGLAKLTYALSNNTTFTGTWFGSGQWADSTGNGDNDNIPYDTRLAQVQAAQPGLNPLIQCSLPGDKAGSPSGIVVATDGNPQTCYSSAQVAAASNGPFGGGDGRARGTGMFDYHARLESIHGKSTYTADYFFNHYNFFKTSENASGLNSDGTCCAGTVYSQFLNTQGILVSDDIVNEKSEYGFGYFVEHQLQTRLNYQFTGQNQYSYANPQSPGYASVFAKGSAQLTPEFSVYVNAWVKRSNVTQSTSFDPRVSLVMRPQSGRDVYRLTYGRSTGDPAAELKFGGINVTGNPSSLNPSCTPYNVVAQGSNPGILPETADDLELGYAHRFARDSSVQLNLYQTDVSNQLFAAALPFTQYAGPIPIDPTLLAGFAAKISSAGCPGVSVTNANSVIPYLALSTTYNAASARYKGIELSGRQRFSNRFYVDYTYDIQSATQNGINDNILQNNPFIINGGQILGIPVNQGSIGFDYSTPQGWEARADGYFTGSNNVSQRPAYQLWSGFVGKQVTKNLSIKLGVYNIFNDAVQNYGYFGHQLFIPENHFFSDSNSIQQYINTGSGEEFGLTPRSFLMTFSETL